MASKPTNEHAENQYDETAPARDEQQNIPTVAPAARPAVTRKGRAVPDTELTLEVRYVSGPEAESLARTQYEAIKEILEWLHTTHPPKATYPAPPLPAPALPAPARPARPHPGLRCPSSPAWTTWS